MKISDKIKTKILARFPALKHKNFRYFLTGQCISLMGTWMQRTAQQWVIYQLTQSPFVLGLVGVCQFMPMLLFSLFAGVLADRFPKKRFLMITQTIQMIQAFILVALLWSGQIRYWHILILAGFLGLANTFDMPARQSFFIELVGKDDLVSAIGLNSTIVNIARIAGPAIAGIFLSYFGAPLCFLANGLSFIAVLIGLFRIQSYAIHIREKTGGIFHEIVDGLKYIFSKPILSNAVIAMLIVGTIAMNSDVIIPVFAKETFHQQASGYSFMLSAMGIGSLIGSLIFAVKRRAEFIERMLFKSAILLSLFLIVTGLMYYYYFALFSISGVGLFNMIFMATVNSTIQLNSSDEYRGRAVSVYSLVFTGTSPIGNFFTGLVTQKLGPNMSFLINGLLTMALIAAIFTIQKIMSHHIVCEKADRTGII
ncbi:MAG TPA: MFS transporter [Bacillota bacterium]|nr:MFS transporter [Bacillota bacterium]